MKITIFGHLAAGKSTLSLNLSKIYKIPIFHIDEIVDSERFIPLNYQEEAITYRVNQIIRINPSWIIEGITTYKELELRANEADMIIFLDLSLSKCFFRSLKRFFNNRGKQRLGGGKGCLEIYGINILVNIIRTRLPKHRKLFNKICKNNSNKTVILKSQKEIDNFIKIEKTK
mgnify:CR=1 FL=1